MTVYLPTFFESVLLLIAGMLFIGSIGLVTKIIEKLKEKK